MIRSVKKKHERKYMIQSCKTHTYHKISHSYLTLKAPNKIAADDTFIYFIFYFYLLKKIRLDVSCESSAWQRIQMKYQVLFSLKNNEKIFMNVVCCSPDWRFEG